MGPFALALIGLAGGLGLWKVMNPKPNIRFVGDYAHVGDTIHVAPDFLQTTNLPPWPNGKKPLWVAILVEGMDKDRIQGPITGLDIMPQLPAKLGSFTVMKSAIFKVIRNGKVIADNPGASTMTGEG